MDSYMDIIGKKYSNGAKSQGGGGKKHGKGLAKKRSNDVARIMSEKDGSAIQSGKKGSMSGAGAYPGITAISIGAESNEVCTNSLIDSRNLSQGGGWKNFKPKTHERIP